MDIIGFLDLQDFAHPSFFSRHLVTPIVPDPESPTSSGGADNHETTGVITSIFSGNKPKDIGFRPSFCVLLHGSLKTEKMGGVVQFRWNIFILYSGITLKRHHWCKNFCLSCKECPRYRDSFNKFHFFTLYQSVPRETVRNVIACMNEYWFKVNSLYLAYPLFQSEVSINWKSSIFFLLIFLLLK